MIPPANQDSRLAPLRRFYEKTGQELPLITFVPAEELPEPQRQLLCHSIDMTSRLREFHGSEITLDVLDLEWLEDSLIREVILRRSNDLEPVEFGAIRIFLDRLPEGIAGQARDGQRPLGGILEAARFSFVSAPSAFFRISADGLMAYFLSGKAGQTLHGRCNTLASPDGQVFAEIVEILPAAGRK